MEAKMMQTMDLKIEALKDPNTITLSDFNIKLGKMPNFSLQAGESCPGQTKACAGVCYAKKYGKCFPSTGVAYAKNLKLTLLDPNWMAPIITMLEKKAPKYFRIHVSGDFYGPKYIQDWVRICKAFPGTKFLAFTRSWRLPRLRKELNALRGLPNVQVIASMDDEAHNAPEGWRTAYMGQPANPKGPTIKCPGYGPKELTCSECGVCFKALKCNVWFPIH